MSEKPPEKPKSRRGGARPGAGRKPKNHRPASALASIDLAAAMATPPPERLEQEAQRHARTALDALVKQLMAGKSESARVQAANALLDRGWGRPAIESPGEAMLPFFGVAPSRQLANELRTEARRFTSLAITTLQKIAEGGESESARVTAAKSLLDRGLGTVATAKVPDSPFQRRPLGKKEEAARDAQAAATGRYAPPPPPPMATDRVQ